MNFDCDINEFVKGLEMVLLKGKYKSLNVSKTDVINSTVVCMVEPSALEENECLITLSNAGATIAAEYSFKGTHHEEKLEPAMFFFDIERCLKYLKTMNKKENITILKGDDLFIQQEMDSFCMPLSVEHRNINFISRLKSMSISGDTATFGKTLLDTCLLFEGNLLAEAIKKLQSVGSATYKIDYDGGDAFSIMSSNFHKTDKYTTVIPILRGVGNPATVEFTAPISKFCEGTMLFYLKDDKPLILSGTNKKLVMAPYIRAN